MLSRSPFWGAIILGSIFSKYATSLIRLCDTDFPHRNRYVSLEYRVTWWDQMTLLLSPISNKEYLPLIYFPFIKFELFSRKKILKLSHRHNEWEIWGKEQDMRCHTSRKDQIRNDEHWKIPKMKNVRLNEISIILEFCAISLRRHFSLSHSVPYFRNLLASSNLHTFRSSLPSLIGSHFFPNSVVRTRFPRNEAIPNSRQEFF